LLVGKSVVINQLKETCIQLRKKQIQEWQRKCLFSNIATN